MYRGCDDPKFVSPINVVPKKNSFRLITDLRHVNKHCSVPSCVYEGMDEVIKITNPGDKIITFDPRRHK